MLIVALNGGLANGWAQDGVAPAPVKAAVQPLLLDLKAARPYYSPKGAMYIRADFTAITPVSVCLYPDKPEAQFKLEIYRGGYGALENPLAPVQLTPEDTRKTKRIQLASGERHTVLLDIKKLFPLQAALWQPGEYRIQAKFFLCGQNEALETTIPSTGPLHLLILD